MNTPTAKPILKHDGVAAYNPETGLCFGVYKTPLQSNVLSDLMEKNSLIKIGSLAEATDNFDKELESHQIVERGHSIGQFSGAKIPSSLVMADGSEYQYVGIFKFSLDLSVLPNTQIILSPGLLYRIS